MDESDASSQLSEQLRPNVSKLDEQQQRNMTVLQQMRKQEFGDASESEIDAVLDQIEALKTEGDAVESKKQFKELEKA